jgi:hypothetical protein
MGVGYRGLSLGIVTDIPNVKAGFHGILVNETLRIVRRFGFQSRDVDDIQGGVTNHFHRCQTGANSSFTESFFDRG